MRASGYTLGKDANRLTAKRNMERTILDAMDLHEIAISNEQPEFELSELCLQVGIVSSMTFMANSLLRNDSDSEVLTSIKSIDNDLRSLRALCTKSEKNSDIIFGDVKSALHIIINIPNKAENLFNLLREKL